MAYVRGGGGGLKGDLNLITQVQGGPLSYTFVSDYKKMVLVCVTYKANGDGNVGITVKLNNVTQTSQLTNLNGGYYFVKVFEFENIKAGDIFYFQNEGQSASAIVKAVFFDIT